MKRAVAFAAACLASLVVAASAGDDGASPAVHRYESADHRVGLDLPADWSAVSEAPGLTLFTLRVSTPSAVSLVFEVYHVPGFRDARAQACLERGTLPERFSADARGDVVLEPMPHLIMDRPKPGSFTRRVWIYRVLDRNGFTLTIYCDPTTWPAVKDACFAAAKSLTSSIPEWPERLAGYVASERDGYEYLVQPGVADADVATLHQAIRVLESGYAKTHGSVPKPAWNRPVVVVSADKFASARVVKPLAGDDAEQFADVLGGRLVCVPLRKYDAAAREHLAVAAVELFHAQSYGYCASWWMCRGEMRLARAEAVVGRPLPALPDGYLETVFPKTVDPFEKLLHGPAANSSDQATAYVALFRAGAKPWRDAFALFLWDLAATGDWDAAEKKDLLSLDQDKLRVAAQAFLKELKPVKTK